MEDLRDQLARLQDERAIVATLYRYGDALDHGDRVEFLDCFALNAEYVVRMRLSSSNGFTHLGHEQLGACLDGHTHAPAAFHKHVTVNPLVTLDGAAADVRSSFLRVDSPAVGRRWWWRRVGTSTASSKQMSATRPGGAKSGEHTHRVRGALVPGVPTSCR